MIELAKQELKILEAQHPTRFQFLKLQLKEFIHLLTHDEHQDQQFHLSVLTQESSSSRKREREREKKQDGHNNSYSKSKCRIKKRKTESDAIKKAEACLRKIQTLKSFFCSSNH